MWLVLQIMLAIFLALSVLAVVGLWFLRRWFRRTAGEFEKIGPLLNSFNKPARLQLARTDADDSSPELREVWADWYALGFRRLADLSDDSGGYEHLRLGGHAEHRLGLVVSEDDDGTVHASLLAVTENKQLWASSIGLGPELRTSAIRWLIKPDLSPRQRMDKLLDALGEAPLLNLDHRMLATAFKRAHARLMDAEIAAGPPTLDTIRARAAEQKPPLSPRLIEQAWDMSYDDWRIRMEEAVLDNWRRASQIDAVSWERLESTIEVIDEHIRDQNLLELLGGDELTEKLVDQFGAQGLTGIKLYEAVQQHLPARLRRQRLGEVQKPVRATLYALDDEEADDASELGAQAYLYEAVDDDGHKIRDAVLAHDSRDAQRQIREMGMTESRILSTPTPGEKPAQEWLDPDLAARAARAISEPISLSIFRALASSMWTWLPPALLLSWSLWRGAPYVWIDWLIFIYAGLILAVMVCLVGPMLLYDQAMKASLAGKARLAGVFLSLLRWTSLFSPLKPEVLLLEQCKVMAGGDRAEKALALWRRKEPELNAEYYLSGLAQIHDAAGHIDAMIKAQQEVLEISGNPEMPQLDLAMSFARYRRDADAAEALLVKLPLESLSGLLLCAYHYVRGLILAERGQHQLALNQYSQAVEQADSFRNIPTVAGLVSEINGYAALSLRATGQKDRAVPLWQSALPILKMNASSRSLIDRWENESKAFRQ